MSDEALGDLTAARVRDDGELIDWLAALTGLTPQIVRGHLETAAGKTLVRNLFAQNWPVTPRVLGAVRVSLARSVGLGTEIEKVTGLGLRALFKRLEAAHGNSTLATVFKDSWPDDGPSQETDGAQETGNTQDAVPEQTEDASVPVRLEDLDALRLDPNGGWSRPRQLLTVLRSLKWETPSRLRTPRFQSLLEYLRRLGVEIRPTDGQGPFPSDAPSPGMVAQVCLRIMQSSDLDPQRPRQAAAPPRTGAVQGSALSPHAAMVSAPHPPTPKPTAPMPAAPIQTPGTESDYDLCIERLQFLTAVPSLRRHRDPEWPSGYIAAAVEGLSIGARERGLLEQAANDCVRGSHNPLPLVKNLVASRAHHDLDGLIEHFRRLNPDATGAVEEIVRWVEEHKGGRHPPAQPAKAAPQAPVRLAAAAAPTARPASIRDATHGAAASEKPKPIVRNLGALDDMFDDEE